MKKETIDKLCCPFDKADLQLTIVSKDVDGDILEGFFLCGQCQRIYPIVKGVPIMSPDEYREFSLEQPLLQRWTGGNVSEKFRLLPGRKDDSV